MGWSTGPSRPWGHPSRGRRGEWSSRHPPAPPLTTLVRVGAVASALPHSSKRWCHDVPWCSLSCGQARSQVPPLQALCVQQLLNPVMIMITGCGIDQNSNLKGFLGDM